jgi:hypothetical protein
MEHERPKALFRLACAQPRCRGVVRGENGVDVLFEHLAAACGAARLLAAQLLPAPAVRSRALSR